jgi:hypothetical protein
MKNPFFGYYLLGVCQGVLADGELNSAEILFFRDFILTEYAANEEAFCADKFIGCFYDLVKDLPESEDDLTEEMYEKMIALCIRLLAHENYPECCEDDIGAMAQVINNGSVSEKSAAIAHYNTELSPVE